MDLDFWAALKPILMSAAASEGPKLVKQLYEKYVPKNV